MDYNPSLSLFVLMFIFGQCGPLGDRGGSCVLCEHFILTDTTKKTILFYLASKVKSLLEGDRGPCLYVVRVTLVGKSGWSLQERLW
jgi:hypothetical protein